LALSRGGRSAAGGTAKTHESRVIGPFSGAAAEVSSVSPKIVPSFTLPGWIGRKNHRLGRCAAVYRMVAARLGVRARQDGSWAHSAE